MDEPDRQAGHDSTGDAFMSEWCGGRGRESGLLPYVVPRAGCHQSKHLTMVMTVTAVCKGFTLVCVYV